MYPANFFSLFPPFPRDNKIFVAMSFDEQFKARWTNVLEPAINNLHRNGERLEAVRVDVRRIGDSVVTEILDGISRHLMVIADVTTIGYLPATKSEEQARPIRNANVMYEVGLAHAARLPEEILMFRSDSDPLNFDISNIRVNYYDPDHDPEKSIERVSSGVISALRELELKRHFAVRRAVESLDHTSWLVLISCQAGESIQHPTMLTTGNVLANADRVRAIERLLDIGAIKAEFKKMSHDSPTEDLMAYKSTGFGRAIFEESRSRVQAQK